MTSWIWMEGIQEAIADPIAPVNEKDKRPAVKDLIEEHRKKIDDVKRELKKDPLYDATKHDDLWILRFLSSHKKTKPALKAAKHTLSFRQKHNLDEEDIRYDPDINSDEFTNEDAKQLLTCAEDDFVQMRVPDIRLGVVMFFRYPALDQHRLVREVDEEYWLHVFLYWNEWSFQWCDYVTRTTGRLTKFIRIVDVNHIQMSSLSHECIKRDGKVMAVMEDCYPQNMQAVFVCNPPTWAGLAWKIIRPILPKRVTAKIDMINPHCTKEKERLLAYISAENLPARYGGRCQEWPLKCHLPGTGSALSASKSLDDSTQRTEMDDSSSGEEAEA